MKHNFRANTTGMKYSSGYAYILDQFENDRCVILDGAIATELQRVGAGEIKLSDDTHWGFDALHISPESVLNVHQRYLQAGAEVLTTKVALKNPNSVWISDVVRVSWLFNLR